VRQEAIQSSVTREERELLLRGLDLGAADQHTSDELEQLGTIWRGTSAIPSPVLLVARPARVKDHPQVIARFAAFDFAPRRAMAQAGWFVSGYVSRLDDGTVVVRQVAIEPEREGQIGISPDVLRSVNSTQILAKVRAYLSELPAAIALETRAGRPASTGDLTVVAQGARLAEEMATEQVQVGRRKLPDEHLIQVARVCLDEYKHGGRGWLARAAKRLDAPRETVRGWVREARRRGFLGEGERGRSHVEPGSALRRLDQQKAAQ
jgi:transposase-like protein